jgi:nitrate reductase delta subunit
MKPQHYEPHVYELFAGLLEYPGDDWALRLESCKQGLMSDSPELAPVFLEFCRNFESYPVEELQEKYTRTFDLNPPCALEAGYHLFGENYKRGIFLAKLRETEAPYDLGQQHQLPDYLPVLLRLLVKLDDRELRDDLISECMIPAVEKMAAALEGADSDYKDLLSVVAGLLKIEAPGYQTGAPVADFNKMGEAPKAATPSKAPTPKELGISAQGCRLWPPWEPRAGCSVSYPERVVSRLDERQNPF